MSQENVIPMHPPVKMIPILPEFLDDVLDVAVEMLEPAIARQPKTLNVGHVVNELRDASSLLWMAYMGTKPVAAVVTCVVQQPLRRNLKIEWVGGKDMNLWIDDVVSILTKVAKEAKLDAIEADGRKGFFKYAKAASFREIYTHYEMELS